MRIDVLVIGGGMAGAVAASKAADLGREVAVVRKGYGATALSSGVIDIAVDPLGISNESWSGSSSIKRGLQELFGAVPIIPTGRSLRLEQVSRERGLSRFSGKLWMNFLLA